MLRAAFLTAGMAIIGILTGFGMEAIVADPFSEGHRAAERKASQDAAKREISTRNERIKTLDTAQAKRQADKKAPYKGYTYSGPFYR